MKDVFSRAEQQKFRRIEFYFFAVLGTALLMTACYLATAGHYIEASLLFSVAFGLLRFMRQARGWNAEPVIALRNASQVLKTILTERTL